MWCGPPTATCLSSLPWQEPRPRTARQARAPGSLPSAGPPSAEKQAPGSLCCRVKSSGIWGAGDAVPKVNSGRRAPDRAALLGGARGSRLLEKGTEAAAGEHWTGKQTWGPVTAWRRTAEGLGASCAFSRPSAGWLAAVSLSGSQPQGWDCSLRTWLLPLPTQLADGDREPVPIAHVQPIRQAKGSWD